MFRRDARSHRQRFLAPEWVVRAVCRRWEHLESVVPAKVARVLAVREPAARGLALERKL
jgi:hypothetical protein